MLHRKMRAAPPGAAAQAGASDRPLVLRSREAKREPH